MQLKFLYGNDLKNKSVAVAPGTIYLDVATGELFYDDPSEIDTENHNKIIDTATLTYSVSGRVTVAFPFEDDENPGGGSGGDLDGGATSAKLGIAVLGTMVLGAS